MAPARGAPADRAAGAGQPVRERRGNTPFEVPRTMELRAHRVRARNQRERRRRAGLSGPRPAAQTTGTSIFRREGPMNDPRIHEGADHGALVDRLAAGDLTGPARREL